MKYPIQGVQSVINLSSGAFVEEFPVSKSQICTVVGPSFHHDSCVMPGSVSRHLDFRSNATLYIAPSRHHCLFNPATCVDASNLQEYSSKERADLSTLCAGDQLGFMTCLTLQKERAFELAQVLHNFAITQAQLAAETAKVWRQLLPNATASTNGRQY